jgi:hypothetical protein
MKTIGLIFLTIVFFSCEKIKEGTRIQANGDVIDTVKLKPVTDSKVLIHGLLYYGNGSYGGPAIDTFSTTNGSFTFDFLADGNYYGYALSVLNTESVFFNNQGELIEIEPNINNEVDLYARELHSLKANMRISNSSSDSLQITAQYDYFLNKLIGNNFDTTLYFRILPNSDNKLSFYNYERILHHEIIAVDLSDTLTITKTFDFK